jgi:hypothetical protein
VPMKPNLAEMWGNHLKKPTVKQCINLLATESSS